MLSVRLPLARQPATLLESLERSRVARQAEVRRQLVRRVVLLRGGARVCQGEGTLELACREHARISRGDNMLMRWRASSSSNSSAWQSASAAYLPNMGMVRSIGRRASSSSNSSTWQSTSMTSGTDRRTWRLASAAMRCACDARYKAIACRWPHVCAASRTSCRQ